MIENELKEYGLRIHHAEYHGSSSDPDDYEPIDFTIEDDDDNVAWVWGSEPWNDVQCECSHPYQCIDFGDGEEQGECLLCGATCDYHYELDDEGHKVPEAHEWYYPKKIGGVIGKYLKKLQEEW